MDDYTEVFCIWVKAIINDRSKTEKNVNQLTHLGLQLLRTDYFCYAYHSSCFMQVVLIYSRTSVHQLPTEISV